MRKKAVMVDLPFVVGKKYLTTFATGEGLTLTRIERKKIPSTLKQSFSDWLKMVRPNFDVVGLYGIYDKSPHIGECPMTNVVRAEQVKVDEIDVCTKCGHPVMD